MATDFLADTTGMHEVISKAGGEETTSNVKEMEVTEVKDLYQMCHLPDPETKIPETMKTTEKIWII